MSERQVPTASRFKPPASPGIDHGESSAFVAFGGASFSAPPRPPMVCVVVTY